MSLWRWFRRPPPKPQPECCETCAHWRRDWGVWGICYIPGVWDDLDMTPKHFRCRYFERAMGDDRPTAGPGEPEP